MHALNSCHLSEEELKSRTYLEPYFEDEQMEELGWSFETAVSTSNNYVPPTELITPGDGRYGKFIDGHSWPTQPTLIHFLNMELV